MNLDNNVKVFVNGAWIGVTDEPKNYIYLLKIKNIKVLLIFIQV